MTWYENPVLMAIRVVDFVVCEAAVVSTAAVTKDSLLVLLPVIDALGGTMGRSEAGASVVVLGIILFCMEVVLQELYLSIELLFISGHKILEMPRESFIMYSLSDQSALTTLPFCWVVPFPSQCAGRRPESLIIELSCDAKSPASQLLT